MDPLACIACLNYYMAQQGKIRLWCLAVPCNVDYLHIHVYTAGLARVPRLRNALFTRPLHLQTPYVHAHFVKFSAVLLSLDWLLCPYRNVWPEAVYCCLIGYYDGSSLSKGISVYIHVYMYMYTCTYVVVHAWYACMCTVASELYCRNIMYDSARTRVNGEC